MTNQYKITFSSECLDEIVVGELTGLREEFSESMGRRLALFSTDPKEDDAEIQRYIDAIDTILSYYKPLHIDEE